MRNPYFQFQQFTVWHDRCAMKVGTDAVLLGAWADCHDARNALDVGCGCGVIALMLAQRHPDLDILGIDIDGEAVAQAQDNFLRSPFAHRLHGTTADFIAYSTDGRPASFDCIVSNPPFFTEDTTAGDAQRAMARHASSLPFDALAAGAARLLTEQGRLSVVLPHATASQFILTAAMHGLYLQRRCDVQTTSSKPPKRTLLTFGRHMQPATTAVLTMFTSDNQPTDDYRQLTQDFYTNISH